MVNRSNEEERTLTESPVHQSWSRDVWVGMTQFCVPSMAFTEARRGSSASWVALERVKGPPGGVARGSFDLEV